MKTIIYKKTDFEPSNVPSEQDSLFRYVYWKPSLKQFVPPGKSRKYLIYWSFHYLRIFNNRGYAAVLVYDENKLVSSLLVVPSYYKWPFMGRNDVQLTYVLTHPDYRGKGLAEKAIRYALDKSRFHGRNFWYVTDTDNIASTHLCVKAGFVFYGYATKTRLFLKLLNVRKDNQ